jgi:RNA polymerase sigma factor (sigma-70 family)
MKRFGFDSLGRPEAGDSSLPEASTPTDQSPPGFEALAMPLCDSLYNFARWLTHDSADAEDIVQETYLKALRSFATFRPNSNFRAWMFRILKNTFLSSSTRPERHMTVAMEIEEDGWEIAVEYETPDSIFGKRSDAQLVERAIEQLPAHSREVLLLCEVEELSYQQISEALSIPIGTVMSRLARARKAIRESLRDASGVNLAAEIALPNITQARGR